MVEEFIISDINATSFTADHKIIVTIDGDEVLSNSGVIRFEKVTADYSAAIVGTWEGKVTSAQDTYGDGEEHRWEYKADGSFVYYVKDGDDWVPSANTLNEYFVDGNLLCMRWVDNGIEYREWWEIAIDGDTMNWTALRQNPDGTTFTSTFSMTKIE
jgi:glycosyltransferase involved in cell wall biosynthesis